MLPVNDPPSGTWLDLTLEDSTYIFSRGDFSFTDRSIRRPMASEAADFVAADQRLADPRGRPGRA